MVRRARQLGASAFISSDGLGTKIVLKNNLEGTQQRRRSMSAATAAGIPREAVLSGSGG